MLWEGSGLFPWYLLFWKWEGCGSFEILVQDYVCHAGLGAMGGTGTPDEGFYMCFMILHVSCPMGAGGYRG